MLSYTSEDEIRKYFDTDETLSPEQSAYQFFRTDFGLCGVTYLALIPYSVKAAHRVLIPKI